MRVLLDTNILARAAAGPPGLAHRLFLEVTGHEHTLLLSSFLVVELGRVLRYDRVRRLHGLSEDEIDSYLSDLTLIAEMVDFAEAVPEVVLGDPDDDPVVHSAVIGRADFLCTHDRHLLDPEVMSYCQHRGILVGTDVELLRLLQT